ncbi:MAG: RES domain-containing protein [Solirubrobacteraceae bacterium]
MTRALRAVRAPLVVHRIGRAPDPWAWPDWSCATDEGTFGNRYDDPRGAYRVLYSSTQRRGCFLETLARFRPDPALVAAQAEIAGDPRDARFETAAAGTIPAGWLRRRRVGRARLGGEFFDVGHSTSLAWLRELLAARLVHYDIDDLDTAAIRLSGPRRFTQEVGRAVYEQANAKGGRRFAGLRYLSRVGDEFENWALFEPASIAAVKPAERVRRDDPDLLAALELLGLALIPTPSR